ncbi:GIY-YIG nuclease family protein [Helicobacter sp. T3_23-1056]
MENLSQKLLSLPNAAGVYQYIDSSGRVLYIGKAKSLKKRVKSYFSLSQTLQSNTPIPNPKVSLRIASMVRQVANIEILLVNSEQDALILENSLIKQLKPKYNVLLRDDKTYPYIAFDFGLDFPTPTITRNITQTKSTTKNTSYFGPFTSGAKEIINSLLEIYPLVQKTSCVREKKACLFYQIGRCSAPCEAKISKEAYANILDEAISLLKSPHKLLAKLKEKMLSLAESRRYEEAGVYRDRIKKLQNLQSFSALDLAKDVNVDVLYFYIDSFSESNFCEGNFSESNSSLDSHCIDFADFEGSQAREPSSPPKSTKNSTSTTANTRIVAESGVDFSENNNPPSLAEGARGRVKSTLESTPKSSLDSNTESSLRASDSDRGTSPQLQSSDLARKREWAQLRKQNPFFNNNKIDCHANADAFARNDKIDSPSQNYQNLAEGATKDKNNPPSLAEGARGWVESTLESSQEINTESSLRADLKNPRGNPNFPLPCGGGLGGWVKSSDIPSLQADLQNPQTTICHTEGVQATEVSQSQLKNRDISGLSPQYDKKIIDKTIDCHEFATFDKVANSRNDEIDSPSPNYQNVAEGATNDKNNPPSLAEGVRGRVDFSVESSLRASDSERGNPLFNNSKIDCHAKSSDFARNDGDTYHTEGEARNIPKTKCLHNDILQSNKIDCQEFATFDKTPNSSNEGIKHITEPCQSTNQNPSKNPKSQKAILLSLFVRGGKIISIQHEIISLNQSQMSQNQPKQAQSEIYAQIYTQAILNQYSSKLPIIPSEILLPSVDGLPCALLSDFLYSTQGRKIALNAPQIGTKAKILSLAKQNAKEILGLHCAKLDKENEILERLALSLELESSPSRIEVFDTSHHSGRDCVGAMIVYENGEFVKSAYRRYKLSGSDEYSQMREMLVRRAKDFASTPPPNLWLIDGGKPQITLAKEILESCGLNGAIDIVGIAKQKRLSSLKSVDFATNSQTNSQADFIDFANKDFAKSINKTSKTSIESLTLKSKSSKYANRAKGAASDILYTLSNTFAFSPSDEKLQFLQKLRDEAHRFAIAFHREKKKSSALEASVLKKRNLSQAQIKRLLSLIGSFKDIQNLSDDEIKNLLKSKHTAKKSN